MPVLRESRVLSICATKDLDSESSPQAVLLSAMLPDITNNSRYRHMGKKSCLGHER